ncbi:CAP domain-containing protein [Streptomyces sp. NPDC059788]|uniref:CAP domain-containing protein n=1 Tax=Streptomyces sp. NPDC059788 TaxID=3346948 RepID=UPI0036675AD0
MGGSAGRGAGGRGAGRRAGWYGVRAVAAVLVLTGLTVGGPALATPAGARPGLPDATRAAHAEHAARAALAPHAARKERAVRAPGAAHVPRDVEATRAAVVRLVNRERARAGCRPVRAHRTVTRAAQRHSDHMARDGSLSHRERGGSGPGSRLSAVGYDWRRAGENIARGQRGAAEVVRAWARSPEHRVVLADCTFRHAGVGVNSGTADRGPWWTLLLALPD